VVITIIDTGLGNIAAVKNMLSYLGHEAQISSTPDEIAKSDKVILPGVGSYDAGMQSLADKNLISPLQNLAAAGEAKILGICLGMQLLFDGSEEGDTGGLSLLEGKFERIPRGEDVKVPHMRWNRLGFDGELKLFSDIGETNRFYFIHSFRLPAVHASQFDEVGICNYGAPFVAAFRKDNLMGTQFHPEKSHKFGLKLLENFGRM
jgi:imidazole glycerol-phosphate synthase subunit HisH